MIFSAYIVLIQAVDGTLNSTLMHFKGQTEHIWLAIDFHLARAVALETLLASMN